jgi:branched-chain amino acid transport system substrate-binding protein
VTYMCIKTIRYVFLSVLLIFLAGCEETQKKFEPSGKVVKIGFVGPLSGENGVLGSNSLLGARAALQLQPYLLNGDRIEIVALDDQNNPETSNTVIESLVKDENVAAILLGSTSETVLSTLKRLEEYNVPAIALLATHPDVSKGEYTIQIPFDDVLQGTVAALFVMDEMIIDRVAVFVEPEEVHSALLAETFSKTFIEAGGEIDIIEYPPKSKDLQEILIGLRDGGINFLYLPIHGSGVVEIEKICRTMGYDPNAMLSDGVLSRIILGNDNDFDLVEGMLATDVYTNVMITKNYGEKLRKVFDESFSAPKTTYTALGAEGMSILLGAMDGCGTSRDRQCIKRNLHGTSSFLGVNGTFSITAEGKAERPIFINKIVQGKLKFEVMVY